MMLIKVLLFLSPCFAQFANYNSIILGDRAAGMGGAGTALLDDASSASYYNPAVLAHAPGSALSAAVGIYKKYDTQYNTENDYTKTPLKVTVGFFRSLPASTASVIKKDNWTLGLSILVPEYETYKGDLKSSPTNTTSLTYTDETLWVGGTLAHNADENQSWGITLYYTARNFLRSLQDRSYPSTSEAILFNSDEAVTENAIVPIFGYFTHLNKEWNFGTSVRLRGIPLNSTAAYSESYTKTNPYESTTLNNNNLGSDAFIPAKASFGLTKNFNGDFLLAGTVDFYEGLSYDIISLAPRGTYVVRKAITNFSIGAEKTFREWFRVRAGIFSNYSPYPDPNPNLLRFQGEHIDEAGFSANLLFIANNKIAYTFGGYYIGGRGRAMQRIDQNYQVITKSQQIFTMLVGTHFYF